MLKFALFSPLKDHPSSKATICVNHRVISQEGDYCITQYFVDIMSCVFFSSVTAVQSRKRRSSCVWCWAGINTGFVKKSEPGGVRTGGGFDSVESFFFFFFFFSLLFFVLHLLALGMHFFFSPHFFVLL